MENLFSNPSPKLETALILLLVVISVFYTSRLFILYHHLDVFKYNCVNKDQELIIYQNIFLEFYILCMVYLVYTWTQDMFSMKICRNLPQLWRSAIRNMLRNLKASAEVLTNHRDHSKVEYQAVEGYILHLPCWFGLFFC